jgi:hypothetical protein
MEQIIQNRLIACVSRNYSNFIKLKPSLRVQKIPTLVPIQQPDKYLPISHSFNVLRVLYCDTILSKTPDFSIYLYSDNSDITFLYMFLPLHTHPLLIHLDIIVFILSGSGCNHKAPKHIIFLRHMSLTVSQIPFSITSAKLSKTQRRSLQVFTVLKIRVAS